MKIIMTSFYDDGKKIHLNPGDSFDFDDAEAARIIEVGGARKQTDAEIAAELEAAEVIAKAAADKAAAKAGKNPT